MTCSAPIQPEHQESEFQAVAFLIVSSSVKTFEFAVWWMRQVISNHCGHGKGSEIWQSYKSCPVLRGRSGRQLGDLGEGSIQAWARVGGALGFCLNTVAQPSFSQFLCKLQEPASSRSSSRKKPSGLKQTKAIQAFLPPHIWNIFCTLKEFLWKT